ncbi:MAG TPA: hypothetical protein VE890_12055, partial [Thermoguttaceae bacterium]|nr:hypothetical protein [Thermoguttaceae bacterium]
SVPGADEQLVIACNRRAKAHESLTLPPGQKFACVLLPLSPGVTPDSYPTLKASVEAIYGIQTGVALLIDGQTPASIPDGKQLRLVVDAQLRIENVVEE